MLEPFKASYVAAALFGAALTLGQASGAELATDARAAAIHFGHVIGSAGTSPSPGPAGRFRSRDGRR